MEFTNEVFEEKSFASIDNGTCFVWGNKICIKAINNSNYTTSAIDLENGDMYFLKNETVVPIKIKATIVGI